MIWFFFLFRLQIKANETILATATKRVGIYECYQIRSQIELWLNWTLIKLEGPV